MIIFQSEVLMETWFLQNGTVGFLINTTMFLLHRVKHFTILTSKDLTNGTIPILHSKCSLPEWQTQTKEQLTTQTIVKIDTLKNGLLQQKEKND